MRHDICEIKKCFNRFAPLIQGKILIIGGEKDDINPGEFYGIPEGSASFDFRDIMSSFENIDKDPQYDLVIICVFEDYKEKKDNYEFINLMHDAFSHVKSNGHLIIYGLHKFYTSGDAYKGSTPHEVILSLKHISGINIEILDFESFGHDGSYLSIDKNTTEYAYQMIIKRSNDLFGKRNLEDDPGEMMSLDD